MDILSQEGFEKMKRVIIDIQAHRCTIREKNWMSDAFYLPVVSRLPSIRLLMIIFPRQQIIGGVVRAHASRIPPNGV